MLPLLHKQGMLLLIPILLVMVVMSPPLGANELDELDELDALFEDVENTENASSPIPPPSSTKAPSFLQKALNAATWTLSQEAGLKVQQPQNFSTHRSSARLQWEYITSEGGFFKVDSSFYYNAATHTNAFEGNSQERYRAQTSTREFYYQGNLSSNTTFRVGQQILNWGKANVISVLDIGSPKNFSYSLYTPPEDTKVGQQMLQVQHYQDNTQWSFVVNPDPKVNRFPHAGNPYAFDLGLPGYVKINAREKPVSNLQNTELLMRVATSLWNTDLSFVLANVLDNNPVFKASRFTPEGRFQFNPVYRRFLFAGTGITKSIGDFVAKAEFGFRIRQVFNRSKSLRRSGLTRRNVLDAMLGLEYQHGDHGFLIETTNTRLETAEDVNRRRRDETSFYLLWIWRPSKQPYSFRYGPMFHLQDQESWHHLMLTYQLTDQWMWQIRYDYFDAWKERSILGTLKDQTRLGIQLSYTF